MTPSQPIDPARNNPTPAFMSCRYCEGEGYIEDVDDMTAPWLECKFCEGTGDAYGRGHTKANPRP